MMTNEERNRLEQEIMELEVIQEKRRESFAKFHGLTELLEAYRGLTLGLQTPEVFMHPKDLESYMKWLEDRQGEQFARLPYFKGTMIQSDVGYFRPPKGKVYLRRGCMCRDVNISFGITEEIMNQVEQIEDGLYANEIHLRARSASIITRENTDAAEVLIIVPNNRDGAKDLIEQYKRCISEIETVFGFDKTNFT